MMFYEDEDEAVQIANGTTYGLSGYVYGADIERARRVAERLQAGRIYLNNAAPVHSAPFGEYKRSGNGRQQGVFGISEFLEVKAVIGYKKTTEKAM
jgi:aldehyde dehydrogenase (NAD+)